MSDTESYNPPESWLEWIQELSQECKKSWTGKAKTTRRNIKLVPTFIALVWNIIMVAIGAEVSTHITLIFYSSTVMITPRILIILTCPLKIF